MLNHCSITHNFSSYKVVKILNFHVFLSLKFQVNFCKYRYHKFLGKFNYVGITHNFISYKFKKRLKFFVFLALEFQVMILNGGNINCLGKFHRLI